MGNPYKYTISELDGLVEEWNTADDIEWDLKDFIMWTTKFTEAEFDIWMREKRLPTTCLIR